jgi:hypothetical protein
MDSPSEEQQVIIDHVCDGKNVIVDACAGSGKSTTILSAAFACPDKQFLQLTYNKTLRHEVQAKVAELGLANLVVHTYHSLAYNCYHQDGQMDNGIRRILREQMPPKVVLPKFSVIVVDEAQDMTPLYFLLLMKFIADSQTVFQVMVMGDKMQGLYDFKGADTRFLTLAHQCWEHHPCLLQPDFVFCKLKTSYRVTVAMARFVNNALLDDKRLWAVKDGTPVVYTRRENFANARMIVGQIDYLLRECGAQYDDFYILAGSIKGKFIKVIENMLVDRGIPCYLSTMESQDQDKRIIHNKVVFSTFHSVKGRQRRHVFVLGFDESYFKYYARNLPTDVCPNTLYVGCTRARERLFVFEKCGHEMDSPLPFMKMSHSMMAKPEVDYIKFQGTSLGLKTVKPPAESRDKYRYNVVIADLIKFLSESSLDTISEIMDKVFVKIDTETMEPFEDQSIERTHDTLEIQGIKETSTGHFEDVSDINGTVLPMLFYEKLQNNQHQLLQQLVRLAMVDIPNGHHKFLHSMVQKMPDQCESIADYLFVANLCNSVQERLYSKLKQIDSYDWLGEEIVDQCVERFDHVVGDQCRSETWQAEKQIITQSSDIEHYYIDQFVASLLPTENIFYRIGARVDLMTDTSIWEMKCTSNLTVDHKLQLVLYLWIWNMTVHPSRWPTHQKKGFLYNVKTNELLELRASMEELTAIVSEVLKDKYKSTESKTDEEFVYAVKRDREPYLATADV